MTADAAPSASRHPGLPQRWPSAWPSLTKPVLLGCIVPVVAAIIVVIVLALTSSLRSSWWVVLIPLAFLIWPLSLPSRVTSAMSTATREGELEVTVATLGVLARTTRKRLGVQPSAEVVPGKDVIYYLQAPSRKPAKS